MEQPLVDWGGHNAPDPRGLVLEAFTADLRAADFVGERNADLIVRQFAQTGLADERDSCCVFTGRREAESAQSNLRVDDA